MISFIFSSSTFLRTLFFLSSFCSLCVLRDDGIIGDHVWTGRLLRETSHVAASLWLSNVRWGKDVRRTTCVDARERAKQRRSYWLETDIESEWIDCVDVSKYNNGRSLNLRTPNNSQRDSSTRDEWWMNVESIGYLQIEYQIMIILLLYTIVKTNWK